MAKLRKYVFSGSGLALGSEIVVLANDEESALSMAKLKMVEHSLNPDSLSLSYKDEKIKLSGEQQIIHFNNGDY